MSNKAQTFEEWFDGEQKKGLKDIKLAIKSTNAANREIQDEFLKIETLMNNGIRGSLPAQSRRIKEEADEIICRHLADN